MNTVAITYRRLWLTRTAYGSFPGGWGDLSPSQFIAITSGVAFPEPIFLRLLTGLKRHAVSSLSYFHRYKLLQLLDWVKTMPSHHSFIIKTLKTNRGKLVCPGNKLKNFTFGQFVFCDAFYIDYAAEKNMDALNKLVACLYLPQGMVFSEPEAMGQLLPISKLPIKTREAIAVNFQLVRQWLAVNYPLIFTGTTPMIRHKATAVTQPAQSPWIKIFEEIVGDDIINQDRYAALPLHNVLRFLTQKIKNAQR